MATKLSRMVNLSKETTPSTWSHDKWKTSYLHFHYKCGYQTWQSSSWESYQLSDVRDLLTTWLNGKWKSLYLHVHNTFATKLGRVIFSEVYWKSWTHSRWVRDELIRNEWTIFYRHLHPPILVICIP